MRGLPAHAVLTESGIALDPPVPAKARKNSRTIAEISLGWLVESWKELALDRTAMVSVLLDVAEGLKKESEL